MMKISHNGDRLTGLNVTDEYLDELINNDVDVALTYGAYACSTEKIDYLCDLLNSCNGVLFAVLARSAVATILLSLTVFRTVD